MKRILVVEDSPTQAQQIEALLGTEYEVTVARTGEEALTLIDARPFDLVVSDIMMPGITGYDLCRQIKASSRHKDLPVILLTSLTNPMDIVRGLEAGADNYITKPYEPTQLRARIRRVADQHTMRRNQRTMMGVNISFLGSTFTITSEKEQILDVLLSAVEDTVRTNRLLEERQRELADAHARLEASARESARAARISEERARVLMQNAGDAIFLLDAQGTVLEVNSRAVELLGREPELLLYRPLAEFIVEGNGGRLRSTIDRLYREGSASVEGHIVDSHVIVELSGSVTQLDGEAFSLLIARDVTERRQAEERLRRSERQFAEAQQIARVGSWEWRPDEGVLESSEELDRLFGVRFRELGGDGAQVVLRAVEETDRERVQRAFDEVRADVPMDLEFIITAAPGERRIVHARGERVSDEDEPPVVRGTMQDVTERRQVEQRVIERESMLRTLFEASPIAIITLDTQGRVLSWNPAAESIFGWRAEEILGGPLPQIPEGKQHEFEALFNRILTGQAVVNEEVRRMRRDGTLLDISVSAAALREPSGRTTGVAAMMIDISEQKRAAAALHSSEEQLRHAQRMEAIGRLTGGIAHDFNNMLTAIQGTTQLLLMDYGDDKALSDELREIDRASSRAAELTRQLLAFSRKQPVQPKILDLNSVIGAMNRMLDRLVGETVNLDTRLRVDLPSVLADPGQIEQIVMNLVVNARDAIEDGGEVFIETGVNETLFEGATDPAPCVTLSVRDTGSGIEPHVLERIFDPFFTTKPAGVGTGLGLSTVYGIVRQNNGRIQVDSEVGVGTTFTIMLPSTSEDAPGEEAERAAPAEPASGSETVLLVEDDQAIRKLASRVLRRHGYMVLEASSGPEAINVAEQFIHSIQLVVSDMVMPGMSGRELVDRLTAMRPDLRILFISGYSDDSVRNLSPANRRAALLEKPFTADAFAAKVRETLDAH